MKHKVVVSSIGGLILMFSCTSAHTAQKNNQTCGIEAGKPLSNSYGPFDFTNPEHRPKFPIVLNAHFTPQVERLVEGSTGALPHDIDYTLRAIPNFHRALSAMSRFEIQSKRPVKAFSRYYSAECFFKRAIYFQPNDAVSRMLYAIHQHKIGKYDEAETLYQQAQAIAPSNPEIHYNLGLLYMDTGRVEEAKKHAKIAYDGGYPLPGLKNRIARHEMPSKETN